MAVTRTALRIRLTVALGGISLGPFGIEIPTIYVRSCIPDTAVFSGWKYIYIIDVYCRFVCAVETSLTTAASLWPRSLASALNICGT
jgi:hypothetical protein